MEKTIAATMEINVNMPDCWFKKVSVEITESCKLNTNKAAPNIRKFNNEASI